jgi:YVTN family beta-propeller protein
VAVIDAATITVLSLINVGNVPYNIAYKSSNNSVYVTNQFAVTISVNSTTSNTVTATINVGDQPVDIEVLTNADKAYVALLGQTYIQVLNLDTNTITKNLDIGTSSNQIAALRDNTKVYVSSYFGDKVFAVETSGDTVAATITYPASSGPGSIAVNGDNSNVAVLRVLNKNLSIIKTSDNTFTSGATFASTPDRLRIQKIAAEATSTAPMQVTFNVNKGGIVMLYNTNVSIYDYNTGNFIGSDPTDAAGNSIFWLIPGKRYNVTVNDGTTSLNMYVQIQPNDQFYYIDTTTSEIYGSTQYNNLYKLHACTLYVYNWGAPEKYASIQLFKNGVLIKNTTSDMTGGAAYNVQSDVLYTIRVYNTTKNIDKNFTEYLNDDTRTLDLWIISIPGWTYNESTLNQTQPQSIYTNGSVKARTNGADTFIDCSYNDTSGLTTKVVYTLYVSQNGNLTQLDTHTHSGSYGSDTHSFQVTTPTGKDYTVKIVATQANGDITMWFYYHWPGPMVNIPGLPMDWYKYISLVIIGGIALGTASRINVSFVAATMTIAAIWLNNVMGWMFEIPAAPVLIFFMIIISIVMFWTQKSKGEV